MFESTGSPLQVKLTVTEYIPWVVKDNVRAVLLKSVGKIRDLVGPPLVKLLLFLRTTSKGVVFTREGSPLILIVNTWPAAIISEPAAATRLFVTEMVRLFGEVSEQKEFPPTIATDVNSKSCENISGEWIKNIKKNILKKCLISFLILISFNVLQN